MMAYLEFLEPDDYFAYLESRAIAKTHFESGVTTGEPLGELEIRTVNYWAVLSQRIAEANGTETIACCGINIYRTDSAQFAADQHRPEDDRIATKVRSRLAEVKANIESRRFKVIPGKWTNTTPSYMRI